MKYKFLSRYHLSFWIGLLGIIAFVLLYAMPIRSVLYLEFLFLPITLFVLGFISKYDTKIWEKAVVYLIIGLSWEILTEVNWTYANNLLPMFYIYKDIPLAMLFYWISVFSLAFFSFSYIVKKAKVNRLFAQTTTIFSVFLVTESIGFNILGIWNYNFNPIFLIPPYLLPPYIFIGYLIFGNLFLISMHEELYKFRCLANFVSELTETPSKIMKRLIGDS